MTQGFIEVATAADLRKVGSGIDGWDLDKSYIQTADIDLSEYENWVPIGDDVNYNYFSGNYDGNGFVISNLTIDSDARGVGLFGYLRNDYGKVIIRNVTLQNVNITGEGMYVGALVGNNNDANITSCHASGHIQGTYCVGGLIGCGGNYTTVTGCSSSGSVTGVASDVYPGDDDGYAIGGLIGLADRFVIDCHSSSNVVGITCVGGLSGYSSGVASYSYATGDVEGVKNVGGFIGWGGTSGGFELFSSCYSTGDVTGQEYVGGFIGLSNEGSIIACYATGDVSGEDNVGGFAGWNNFTGDYGGESISDCYSIGYVEGLTNVGGFNGHAAGMCSDTITNCFWNTDTSGQTSSDGGTGKTTAEMKDIETYLNANWEIIEEADTGLGKRIIWYIDDKKDYPKLWMLRFGSENNPILVATPEDLRKVGSFDDGWDLDCHYLQIADIDISQYESWDPIANAMGPYSSGVFSGGYDGGDYTISNLTINDPSLVVCVGLFGIANSDAVFRNIHLKDVEIDSTGISVGGLMGMSSSKFTNCTSEGVVKGAHLVGGLVGHIGDLIGMIPPNRLSPPAVVNCHSSCDVTSDTDSPFAPGGGGLLGGCELTFVTECSASGDIHEYANGGLIGTAEDSYISACCATGDVVGGPEDQLADQVGGLIGETINCTLKYCYASGNVIGDEYIGGLIGYVDEGSVESSYSVGLVEGNTELGGLIGFNDMGDITKSYWDVESSGQVDSSGGIGETTENMQRKITFAEWSVEDSNDFDPDNPSTWWIKESEDYPKLFFQWVEQENGNGNGDWDEDWDPDRMYGSRLRRSGVLIGRVRRK